MGGYGQYPIPFMGNQPCIGKHPFRAILIDPPDRLPEPWGLMPTPLALWPKSEGKYLLGCNISIVGAFVLYGELDGGRLVARGSKWELMAMLGSVGLFVRTGG